MLFLGFNSGFWRKVTALLGGPPCDGSASSPRANGHELAAARAVKAWKDLRHLPRK